MLINLEEKTKVLLKQLFDLVVKNDGYYKIDNNSAFMPLVIEIVYSVEDKGSSLSLAHYGESNGDLMRDPEMLFCILENGNIFPYYFRNDWAGVEKYSIEEDTIFDKTPTYRVTTQNDYCSFADMWMINLEEQQDLSDFLSRK